MRFIPWILTILLVAVAGLGINVACDDDFEADDELTPSENVDGDLYSEQCGIDYGIDMGCNAGSPECRHAQRINLDRYDQPDESDCAPALLYDDDAAAVAEAHSIDMCDRGFFDHNNPDGKSPFDRMDDAGIDFVAAGENIFVACGYSLEEVIPLAEDEFMDEPECEMNHRSNILSRQFQFVGVGIFECDDGCIYLTQNFVTYDFDDIREDDHDYCPNFD